MKKTTLSNRFKYLIVILYIFLNGFSNQAKAQMVLIPDTNFRNALITQGFGSCITGNYINSTCSLVTSCTHLDVSSTIYIQDITGIGVFTNLKFLDCSENQITFLPNLPNVDTLICRFNNLTSLPSLSPSLKWLDCQLNQITSLPSLPNTLIYFSCSNNQITLLPTLPSALIRLDFSYNQIVNIPILPISLLLLSCGNNQISSLPALPSSLTQLYCSGNQISSLPALPSSLIQILCFGNQISSLSSLPTSLTNLDCSSNLLTSLPTLPNSLVYLNSSGNLITSLPSLPTALVELHCSSNQLVNLPTIPTTLTTLDCSLNQITSLPYLPNSITDLSCNDNLITILPSLPIHLTSLDCSSNLLITLPSLPVTLTSLICSSNQLTSIPSPLPLALSYFNCQNNPNLGCLPKLNTIVNFNFMNTSITCLPNYGNVIVSQPDVSTLPLCGLFNPSGCDFYWNISGKAYFDTDSNCIFSVTDVPQRNINIKLYKDGNLKQQAFTNFDGNYSFDTDSMGNYQTIVDTTGLPFTVRCPLSLTYSDTLTIVDSLKYNRDFSMKCKGVDLAIFSLRSQTFIPGDTVLIKVNAGDYANQFGANCANGVSGQVNIIFSGPLSYIGPALGALTPSNVSGDTLIYLVSDFGAVNYASFSFITYVDTSAQIGTPICLSAAVSPANDLNPSNNTLSKCTFVKGSFDPNEKEVYPENNLDINGDRWLNYTINFQNTGTAPAQHIYVLDTLNTNLDLSTFQLVAYSHQPYVQILNGGIAKFNFPNINLPDSSSNEPNSHGYVQYRIKAKDSLATGIQISNTAYIYFDFNTPVVTNTVSNTIINCAQNINNISVTICNGSSYNFNGLVLTQPGIYSQRFITNSGCDSVVNLTLNVHPLINQSNNTLTASATNASYQWINCSSGILISGATSQSYTPTITGSYAVIVVSANCTDTSACHTVTITGINENTTTEINISPNPSHDEFILSCPQGLKNNIYIKVFDAYGKLIEQKQITSGNTILKTTSWSPGIYFMQITESENVSVKKLIRE